MMEYVYSGIGGVFGAIARYGLSKWVGRHWNRAFPLATFCINIIGSFILGILFVVFSKNGFAVTCLQDLIVTGFLGAFTTFSTFAYEIVILIEDGDKDAGMKYFIMSIIAGLAAAFLGMTLGEHL
ncbi:fluoride efflux transporter CrcB [Phosphitispora sp. TUW77]|uniref:fluoride efflux transporter CrcB n=1 Tax=Phosphitispora sp. TUW77 TaxID=3152361 RepID=UPI003AB15DC2